MKIKICGLHDHSNLKRAMELRPDFVGLNFYPQSKRFYKHDYLPEVDFAQTKLVGVFVNESVAKIKALTQQFKFSLIQFHGTESLEQLSELKSALPECEIVKVFGIESEQDLDSLESWTEVADYFLFDKKALSFGGTGQKFSWDILQRVQIGKKFFLAGGIGPEDARAVRSLQKVVPELYAVDINSRFEDKAGLKDIQSLRKFFEEVRK